MRGSIPACTLVFGDMKIEGSDPNSTSNVLIIRNRAVRSSQTNIDSPRFVLTEKDSSSNDHRCGNTSTSAQSARANKTTQTVLTGSQHARYQVLQNARDTHKYKPTNERERRINRKERHDEAQRVRHELAVGQEASHKQELQGMDEPDVQEAQAFQARQASGMERLSNMVSELPVELRDFFEPPSLPKSMFDANVAYINYKDLKNESSVYELAAHSFEDLMDLLKRMSSLADLLQRDRTRMMLLWLKHMKAENRKKRLSWYRQRNRQALEDCKSTSKKERSHSE